MNNMENVLHLYLCKLRIIGKIPVGGKIDITNNDLNIYTPNFFNWVYRKVNGDCKDNAALYLLNLYKDVINISEQVMYEIELERSEILKKKKFSILISLTEKLKESIYGIKNLIDTYKNYLKITSQLECLEHDVIIPHYKRLINFIPSEFHTDILKTSITYSNIDNAVFKTRIRSLSENNASYIYEESSQNNKEEDIEENETKKDISNDGKKTIKINRSEPIKIQNKKKHKQPVYST